MLGLASASVVRPSGGVIWGDSKEISGRQRVETLPIFLALSASQPPSQGCSSDWLLSQHRFYTRNHSSNYAVSSSHPLNRFITLSFFCQTDILLERESSYHPLLLLPPLHLIRNKCDWIAGLTKYPLAWIIKRDATSLSSLLSISIFTIYDQWSLISRV